MNKHLYILLVSLSISWCIHAQYRTGLSTSNYDGIQGIRYNPSKMVGGPISWDYNLLSIGLFLDNNFATIPNNSIPSALGKTMIFTLTGIPRTNLNEFAYIVMNTDRKNNNFGTDIFIQGPAFSASTHDKSFAFFINTRINISLKNIDDDIANYMASQFNLLTILNGINIEKMRINLMAWNEVGVSYGYTLMDESNLKITGAISPKLLISPFGTSLRINQLMLPKPDIDGDETEEEYLDRADVDLNLGLRNYQTILAGGGLTSLLLGGFGLGADAGITIQTSKLYQSRRNPSKQKYLWQAGVALIDFGGVIYPGGVQSNIDSSRQVSKGVDDGGYQVLLDNIVSNKGVPAVILPTAITSHIDLSLKDNFYLQSRLVLGTNLLPNQLRAPHSFTIAPRFESKLFDIAFPVTLHDFSKPRFGFNFRASFLTIGSDNLSNWFIPSSTISGTDFYIAMRLYKTKRYKKANTIFHRAMRKKKTKSARKRFRMAAPKF